MAFAGTVQADHKPTGRALGRVLAEPDSEAGEGIVALLRELAQREPEWAV